MRYLGLLRGLKSTFFLIFSAASLGILTKEGRKGSKFFLVRSYSFSNENSRSRVILALSLLGKYALWAKEKHSIQKREMEIQREKETYIPQSTRCSLGSWKGIHPSLFPFDFAISQNPLHKGST